MRAWAFFMGAFLWYALASTGHPDLGFLTFIASSFYAILPSEEAKSKKDKKAKYEELPPIIIESKRGAPYRIPDKITLGYKEKSGAQKDWTDKTVSAVAGLFGKALKEVKETFEDKK